MTNLHVPYTHTRSRTLKVIFGFLIGEQQNAIDSTEEEKWADVRKTSIEWKMFGIGPDEDVGLMTMALEKFLLDGKSVNYKIVFILPQLAVFDLKMCFCNFIVCACSWWFMMTLMNGLIYWFCFLKRVFNLFLISVWL